MNVSEELLKRYKMLIGSKWRIKESLLCEISFNPKTDTMQINDGYFKKDIPKSSFDRLQHTENVDSFGIWFDTMDEGSIR